MAVSPSEPIGSFAIPPGHPCLDGHFPGNPLVPGVVLLDEALSRIASHFGWGPPVRVQSIKFLTPVRSGDVVQVELARAGTEPGNVRFACVVRGSAAVTGIAGFA
jgi:3-hydroxymyristoyl/3-hydroxydecanoyl-(acyl carrier protein) dehydratase